MAGGWSRAERKTAWTSGRASSTSWLPRRMTTSPPAARTRPNAAKAAFVARLVAQAFACATARGADTLGI
ncbi:uncharacterized protein SOCE26_097390 [Sorangium cellulosum]|uniref:Uncharacterized protein n=1 Tax=Sorangium cellulosum TaxID=56 RepID=A0A2L0F9E0_SORCE|nr:uncharacterized protein SOCE26_097390 [Sorangium cellulosum]